MTLFLIQRRTVSCCERSALRSSRPLRWGALRSPPPPLRPMASADSAAVGTAAALATAVSASAVATAMGPGGVTGIRMRASVRCKADAAPASPWGRGIPGLAPSALQSGRASQSVEAAPLGRRYLRASGRDGTRPLSAPMARRSCYFFGGSRGTPRSVRPIVAGSGAPPHGAISKGPVGRWR